ncbi:MAG: hypothetical protein HFG68_08010 [Hungatella sp.]|nr:hypothetical protein [Hungatella sp.]
MASVRFQKGSKEWNMFRDYWNLCQKFWIPEDSEEYWNLVLKESIEFKKKYESLPLANEIRLVLLEHLFREAKKEVKEVKADNEKYT